jgi:DNA-binding NarL/FixJ family response regulator
MGRRQRPSIEAPRGLAAWRFDVEDDAFVLLEWPASSSAPPAKFASLSPAEAAVVTLAVSGLSNDDIAFRRCAATRTVANQIGSAFRKLGVHSRAELIASFAPRRSAEEP